MSEEDNPYAAPASEVAPAAPSAGGSIDNTLAGNADLSLGDVFSEGWKLISGTKGIIIGGFVLFYVAFFILVSVLGVVLGVGLEAAAGGSTLGGFLIQLAINAALYPFLVGVAMIGVKQAAGQSFAFNDIFGYYHKVVPLLITYILMTVAVMLGFLLLVIPGIWLGVATVLAPVLVVEKDMNPVDALLTSVKIVTKKWFTVFFVLFLGSILMTLSAIPLLIGLVWTLPWLVMMFGIIYRQLAGVGTPAEQA